MLKGDCFGLDVKKVLLTANPLEIKKMMVGEGKIKFAKSKEELVDLL